MVQKHLRIEKSKLAYNVFGNGDKVMLLFHGYGQDSSLYNNLPGSYLEEFTCIAVDLFGHGASSFFAGEKIEPKDWKFFMATLLDAEGVDRFSVLGFSLGGRVAINTVCLFKNKVDSLVLLAPDGIIDSFIYKIATGRKATRKVFRRMVFYPKIYQSAIRLVKNLNLVDSASIEFVKRVMSTRSRRYRLYRVWNMYAGLTFKIEDLKDIYGGDISLYLAMKDHFIDTNKAKRVCDKLKIPYKVVNTGHFQIVSKYFNSIYR